MAKSRSDNTIKALIYILIFLIMVLIILILFIIPNIKSYKINKSDLKIFSEKNKYLAQKQIELQKDIKEYEIKNSNYLKKFDKKFDPNDFIAYASKYLKDIKLTKKNEVAQFDIYELNASTPTKSPEMFFKFIDSLKEYSSLIKINFPINIISSNKSLNLSFNIGVYKIPKK